MDPGEQWYVKKDWKLTEVKAAMKASQDNTAENGWYPAFWENHDQPRSVSNFFSAGVDREGAAKVLAAVLMTTRGTPFIYQGEELGFANVAWDSIDDYEDGASRNQYEEALLNGLSADEALACVQRFSRDNARTPMQWDDSANAGFTSGTPWLPVHDDFAQQNAEVESADDRSVLAWYRELADLRSSREELIAGAWEELLGDSEEILAFCRELGDTRAVTLVNWTEADMTYDPSLVEGLELLAGSHGAAEAGKLRPLEATVWGSPR